jgi:hypothetical protein
MSMNNKDFRDVRQRLSDYDARVSVVMGILNDKTVSLRDVQSAYKRLKGELKAAYEDMKQRRREDDMNAAELAYWERAIAKAFLYMTAPTNSSDRQKIGTSLYEAHSEFAMAISRLDSRTVRARRGE